MMVCQEYYLHLADSSINYLMCAGRNMVILNVFSFTIGLYLNFLFLITFIMTTQLI